MAVLQERNGYHTFLDSYDHQNCPYVQIFLSGKLSHKPATCDRQLTEEIKTVTHEVFQQLLMANQIISVKANVNLASLSNLLKSLSI